MHDANAWHIFAQKQLGYRQEKDRRENRNDGVGRILSSWQLVRHETREPELENKTAKDRTLRIGDPTATAHYLNARNNSIGLSRNPIWVNRLRSDNSYLDSRIPQAFNNGRVVFSGGDGFRKKEGGDKYDSTSIQKSLPIAIPTIFELSPIQMLKRVIPIFF